MSWMVTVCGCDKRASVLPSRRKRSQKLGSAASAAAITFNATAFPKDQEKRNEIIVSLVQLCNANGVEYIDKLPIKVSKEDLDKLFDKHGYAEAIIFGHALEGNLHFVFTQGFDTPEQVARYSAFMDEVTQLVAVEFGGSLKAEHGTGRNMAPFLRRE